jgi:hypothetical protein
LSLPGFGYLASAELDQDLIAPRIVRKPLPLGLIGSPQQQQQQHMQVD